MAYLRRREFIGLLGWAAVWPLSADAQQHALPLVGFLHGGAPGALGDEQIRAFLSGLRDNGGFVDGEHFVLEFRWARGRLNLLPELARELVERRFKSSLLAGRRPRRPLNRRLPAFQ